MRIAILAASGLLLSTSLAHGNSAAVADAAVSAWSRSAQAFAQAIDAACPSGNPDIAADTATKLQPSFRALVLAWQTAQPWLVGPDMPVDLPSRVWFWPDPHGSANRQLERSIASGMPVGIAGHGLGLAEEILFSGADASQHAGLETKDCLLLREVASFQADLARGTAEKFQQRSLSEEDRTKLLLTSMRDALDQISQEQLGRPLGLEIGTARGRRALAWRSGLSLDLIGAGLMTVKAIYLPPDGLDEQLAKAAKGISLDKAIRTQFARADQALANVAMPLDRAVGDPDGRRLVEALLHEVQELRLLVVERLAPALGVSLGFNALDGD